MASVSLVSVPSEQAAGASCPNCSAALAPDQHYCLTCGRPVSPVRLAFLDVLQSEHRAQQGNGSGWTPYPGAVAGAIPSGYAPVIEPSGAPGSLRRYSGLFGLLSVLLLAIVVGLLVGHWVTQAKTPSQQVFKVEGLTAGVPAAAASATTAPATPATGATAANTPTTPAAPSKSSAKTEAVEVKEAKAIERKPPPKPVKASAPKLKKLGATTGKKHEEEINSLGAQPIETGG